MRTPTDPIFKGCTRPAMLFGVPLMPMIILTGATLLISVWVGYLISPYISLLLFVLYLPTIITFRQMTLKDDQRLLQAWLRMKFRVRQKWNHRRWGAITFGPVTYKRRR